MKNARTLGDPLHWVASWNPNGRYEIGHYRGQQGWYGGILLGMLAMNFTPSSLVIFWISAGSTQSYPSTDSEHQHYEVTAESSVTPLFFFPHKWHGMTLLLIKTNHTEAQLWSQSFSKLPLSLTLLGSFSCGYVWVLSLLSLIFYSKQQSLRISIWGRGDATYYN